MRPQADSLKGGRTIASLSEDSAGLENAEPTPALFFLFHISLYSLRSAGPPIPLSLIPPLFSLFSDN